MFNKELFSSSKNFEHSILCKCSQCMKCKLSLEQQKEHLHAIQSTMVDRKNPDNPDRSLMKSSLAYAIIHPGDSVNMMQVTGIRAEDLPSGYNAQPTEPQELTIHATWKNRIEEKAESGRDASVFGAMGVMLIPNNIKMIDIPKMNALTVPTSFLAKYGAKLIPLNQQVELESVEDPSLKNLFLVQYDFDQDYIEQYVMKISGGGGLFVEKHPFPHVFIPLSNSCEGALILGVNNSKNTYQFAAFTIPFGFSMKIESNVIHGDSFFVGPYAIALTETELADSVLLRQENPERSIEPVMQTEVPAAKLPILAEHRLATKLNHQMMIEKILHEKSKNKSLDFFQALPTYVLCHVRSISQEATKAYIERLRIIDKYEKLVNEDEEYEPSTNVHDHDESQDKTNNTDMKEITKFRRNI